MIIATALLAVSLTTSQHYILLYGTPNKTYVCAHRDAYIEQFDNSHFTGWDCSLSGSDTTVWPDIYQSAQAVELDLDAVTKSPIPTSCRFVATSNGYAGNSSTVLDCRPTQ